MNTQCMSDGHRKGMGSHASKVKKSRTTRPARLLPCQDTCFREQNCFRRLLQLPQSLLLPHGVAAKLTDNKTKGFRTYKASPTSSPISYLSSRVVCFIRHLGSIRKTYASILFSMGPIRPSPPIKSARSPVGSRHGLARLAQRNLFRQCERLDLVDPRRQQ